MCVMCYSYAMYAKCLLFSLCLTLSLSFSALYEYAHFFVRLIMASWMANSFSEWQMWKESTHKQHHRQFFSSFWRQTHERRPGAIRSTENCIVCTFYIGCHAPAKRMKQRKMHRKSQSVFGSSWKKKVMILECMEMVVTPVCVCVVYIANIPSEPTNSKWTT